MTHMRGAKVLMLSYSVVSDSLQPHGLRSLSDSAACEILQARILEGCHFLLQGIFPTQGLNPRPQWFSGKESACNAGAARDTSLISGWGSSPGGGHGNPLQCSCLENPIEEEPGGLQYMGSRRVGRDGSDLARISALAGRFFTTEPPGKPGGKSGVRQKEPFCSGVIEEERVVHGSENVSNHLCTGRVERWESESEVTQSCPTLCEHMDCSPPGSSILGFSRQEYWSGLPSPSPGDLSNPGMEPRSPALQADAFTI